VTREECEEGVAVIVSRGWLRGRVGRIRQEGLWDMETTVWVYFSDCAVNIQPKRLAFASAVDLLADVARRWPHVRGTIRLAVS